MSTDRDTSIEYGAAFLLGALLGVGLTLLLTPKPTLKGEVRKQGKRIKKEASKASEDFLDQAEAKIGSLAEEISAAVEDGVQTIRGVVAEELTGLEKQLARRKKKRKRGLFG